MSEQQKPAPPAPGSGAAASVASQHLPSAEPDQPRQQRQGREVVLAGQAEEPRAMTVRDPYQGVSFEAFPENVQNILEAPVNPDIVQITPDGRVYAPEIHYRRVLKKAFGAGGWAMVPRGPFVMNKDATMSREYALFVLGRFVSEVRGEQDYIASNQNTSEATATEGVKSNALMRCCKDLGIHSELWDPSWTGPWKKKYAVKVRCAHVQDGKTKFLWRRQDADPLDYPWREAKQEPAKQPPPTRSGHEFVPDEGYEDPAPYPGEEAIARPSEPPPKAPSKAPPKALKEPAQDKPKAPVPPHVTPVQQTPPATAPHAGTGPKIVKPPEKTLHQRLASSLKKAIISTGKVADDAMCKKVLKGLTGKEDPAELADDTVLLAITALAGVSQQMNELRVNDAGELKIVSKADGSQIYPLSNAEDDSEDDPAPPAGPPPPQTPTATEEPLF